MKNLCFIALIPIFHSAFPHSLNSCTESAVLSRVPGLGFPEAFVPVRVCEDPCWGLCAPVPIWAAAVLWGPLPSGAERDSALLAVPSEAAPLGTFFSHDLIVTTAWGQSGFCFWPPACSLGPGSFPCVVFDNCLCSCVISYLCQHEAHGSQPVDKGALIPPLI